MAVTRRATAAVQNPAYRPTGITMRGRRPTRAAAPPFLRRTTSLVGHLRRTDLPDLVMVAWANHQWRCRSFWDAPALLLRTES